MNPHRFACIVGAALLLAALPASAIELQGHRGARGLMPENTLPAFEAGIAAGVDVLELDTGITSDGHVVVRHDIRLSPDKARDGDGNWVAAPGPLIHALTLAELRRYDVGRARPDSSTARHFRGQAAIDGTPIPTLAEVLALGRRPGNDQLRFNIETKLTPLAPDDTVAPDVFARTLLDAITTAGVADRVTIQSFDWRTLRIVRRLAPAIPTVCLTAERDWLDNLQIGQPGASPWTAGIDVDDHDGSPAQAVKAAGCAVWSPYFRDLTPPRLAEAHAHGLQVVVWTVDQPADIKRLADMGVDGIITDYPDRAAEVLKPYRK